MSKDQINQFDATAGNNTDIEGINTSETMVPSAVNNAIRSLMSLLKKQDVGTHAMTSPDINGGTVDGANITVGSGKTLDVSGGTLTLANDQISGDKINGGSISSTFVGNLTGDVTGNTSGTAATVTGAAQSAITSVGALTGLDVNGAATIDSSAGPALQVTQSTAGENGLRVVGSHASFTGNILQPWSVRAANSAFDFIECVGNNGSEVPFRVRGDGALTTIGSVGFPTLNANYKLAVTGGLAVGAAGATVAAGETFVVTDASHVAKITVTGGTAQFGTKSAADLVFMRANGEAGRFTATGLGIGTTSPGQKLTIDSGYTLHTNGYGLIWGSDTYIKGQGDSSQYVFLNATGTQVGISSTGNAPDLGRGLHIKYSDTTATVNAGFDNLVIEENDNNGLTILSATNGEGGIAFGDSGDNDIGKLIYDHDGDYMAFTANAAERMRITSAGNVGIGVTPTIDSALAGLSIGGKVLHVHDGAGASLKLSDNDSGSNRGLGIASIGSEAAIVNCEASDMRLGTGNQEKMRIDHTRDGVAIGATVVTNDGPTTANSKLRVYRSGVTNANLAHSTNGHYFSCQSDDGTDGFEIYQQHGTNTTRNSFIVNDNRTGSKSMAFAVRNDGQVTVAGTLLVGAEGGTATTNVSLGLCKAWVRTSGAAVSVSDSFNMSSVTDSGVGLYAPVINNNMNDGAYAVISSGDDKQDGAGIFVHNINDAVAQATTGYATSFKKYAYALADANQNAASAAFGDLA